MKPGRALALPLRRAAILFCIAVAAALAQQNTFSVAPTTEAGRVRQARLYGIVGKDILNNLNEDDAKAAIKSWFAMLGQQKGFILDTKVDITDGAPEIRKRLDSRNVDILVLDVPEYLELESSHLIVPLLTHARSAHEGAPYSYVLLVKPSSAATSVASLRGKNVLVFSRNGGNGGSVWTDVLLGKEKLGRAASFFASIKATDKAQACTLPLFFGSVDACVVDEINLNLAKELNPQLGELKVLARSRPIIETVIALPADPIPFQKDLLDTMLSLHESARGRQVLMVFKTQRLLRIDTADLDVARELWVDYYRLPGAAANVRPGLLPVSDPVDRGKASRQP